MNAVATPVAMHRAPAPEDSARADFYAVLARLFMAPPDGALLAALAQAPELTGDGALVAAWRDLTRASSAMDADAAAEEYEKLFGGMGKAPVSIYAGFYAGTTNVEHPRVRILNDLAALGLGRPDDITEPEDHFAGLLEAMRVLVGGGAGRGPSSLAEQRRFCEAHLMPGWNKFFAALAAAKEANYYRRVAAFAAAFAALETESFRLD